MTAFCSSMLCLPSSSKKLVDNWNWGIWRLESYEVCPIFCSLWLYSSFERGIEYSQVTFSSKCCHPCMPIMAKTSLWARPLLLQLGKNCQEKSHSESSSLQRKTFSVLHCLLSWTHPKKINLHYLGLDYGASIHFIVSWSVCQEQQAGCKLFTLFGATMPFLCLHAISFLLQSRVCNEIHFACSLFTIPPIRVIWYAVYFHDGLARMSSTLLFQIDLRGQCFCQQGFSTPCCCTYGRQNRRQRSPSKLLLYLLSFLSFLAWQPGKKGFYITTCSVKVGCRYDYSCPLSRSYTARKLGLGLSTGQTYASRPKAVTWGECGLCLCFWFGADEVLKAKIGLRLNGEGMNRSSSESLNSTGVLFSLGRCLYESSLVYMWRPNAELPELWPCFTGER